MWRLVFACLAYGAGLLLFQAGFLLKRTELEMHSQCHDARVSGECWIEQRYDRVVLVVVDALRFDFLAPVFDGEKRREWQGHMPRAAKLVNQHGAWLVPILADPPTTTLQRLKALTTGTLPTFIDAGDNFSPDAEVREDNLLYQINHAKGRGHRVSGTVSMLGDDTWMSLYPHAFVESRPQPSFDVHDLHTVDRAVRADLPHFLHNVNATLTIAHVLGVDHCGHKYGPSHPEMRAKLDEMDQLMASVASSLDESSLLVVVGDHGMTESGDHGGDSDVEVTAGMMLYTRSTAHPLGPPPTRPIRQVDLVPTLALLLGVPIPFSSLGSVIEEAWPLEWRRHVVELNYEQMRRFARAYAGTAAGRGGLDLSAADVDASSVDEMRRAIERLQVTLRAAWTQFSDPLILAGLMTLAESVLFHVSNLPITWSVCVVRSGFVMLQLAVYADGEDTNPALSLLEIVLSLSMVYHCVALLIQTAAASRSNRAWLLCRVLAVSSSLVFFSNSFVNAEAAVVRYLLQTALVVCYAAKRHTWRAPSRQSGWSSLRHVLCRRETVAVLLGVAVCRLEPVFHRCREEEAACEQYAPTTLAATLSPDAAFWRLVVGAFSLLTLNWLIGRGAGRERAGAVSLIGRAISWPAHLLIVLHWTLGYAPEKWAKQTQLLSLGCAQLVYVLSAVCVCLFWLGGGRGGVAGRGGAVVERVWLAHTLSWPVLLLLGDGHAPAAVAFGMGLLWSAAVLADAALPSVLSLSVSLGFYLLGHSPTLTAIPWTAAFTGVPGNMPGVLQAIPGLFVLVHLYAAGAMTVAVLPVLTRGEGEGGVEDTAHSILCLQAVRCLCASLAASLLRRHLMVWKIFAPRFIFEGCGLLFLIVLLLITVTGRRVL